MTQGAALPGNLDLYLHVRVLIGIILGLSVTRLVSGIAALVQHPKRYRIWPVHLGWVAWALVNVPGEICWKNVPPVRVSEMRPIRGPSGVP